MRDHPPGARPLRLLFVLALAGLATAAPASAAVRTADGPADDGRGKTLRPASLTAVYDDAAGTIEVRTVATAAVGYGDDYDVVLSASCPSDDEKTPEDAPPDLILSTTGNDTASPPATAELDGKPSSTIPATATIDGTNVTFTVSDPSLRGRDWRCVSGVSFKGYEPLTTKRAVAALRTSLATKFKVAENRITVGCYAPGYATSPRVAACRAQYRRKGRATTVSATVDNRDGPIRVRTTSTRSFSQRVARCAKHRAPYQVGPMRTTITALSISGRFQCGSRPLNIVLQNLRLDAVSTFPSGPRKKLEGCVYDAGSCNLSGPYAAQLVFPCKRKSSLSGGTRRYTLRCTNRVGDRFTVSFTAREVSGSNVVTQVG